MAGQRIRLPLPRKNKSSSSRKAINPSRQRLLDAQRREEASTSATLDQFHSAIHQPARPNPQPGLENHPQGENDNDDAFVDFNHNPADWTGMDVNDMNSDGFNAIRNIQAHISSPTYETKILLEEENWRKVIPKMFPAYVTALRETSNWGNLSTWNQDFKPVCDCPDQGRQEIDAIDLLSRSSHLAMIRRPPFFLL